MVSSQVDRLCYNDQSLIYYQQMGNTVCKECGQDMIQPDLTLNIPLRQQKIEAEKQLDKDSDETLRQKTKSSMSSIRIEKIKPIELHILNGVKVETIKIPLKGMTKKCSEFRQQKPKIDIYSVELGTHQERQTKQGPMIQYAIISPEQQSLSAIAFVGQYQSNKKSRGLYLLLRESEAFMFQGVFNGEEASGMKVILGSGKYQKYWGKFNSKFQLNGIGQQFVFVWDGDQGEYYHFSGNFENGVREGPGVLKIREEQKDIYEPRNSIRKNALSLSLINDAQFLLKNRKNQELVKNLIELLSSLSGYVPSIPPVLDENNCKLVVKGTWRKGLIEGLTEEKWPLKKYRFYGMYRENERDGYGEQFAYDQRISKGFYKNGGMETSKDNQYLLLGFRLLNGLWRRNSD